jgi:hypothetical protein
MSRRARDLIQESMPWVFSKEADVPADDILAAFVPPAATPFRKALNRRDRRRRRTVVNRVDGRSEEQQSSSGVSWEP